VAKEKIPNNWQL